MKKLLFISLLVIFFSSCTKEFIQIFDTETVNTKSSNGFWVFETDTIKITYEFWASTGIMSFSVYNKYDKPIYIDWKNCSFIYNGNKLNYWIDEQNTSLLGYYGGYFYNGPLIKPGFNVNEGVQASTSTISKPERITFIPPRSYYYRSQFYLYPFSHYDINPKSAAKRIVPRNDKPNKNTTVYETRFTTINSPLNFRNYLAISLTEISTNYFYIDNEFYLSSIKEMDYRHFRGEYIDDKGGEPYFEKPDKKKTSFYIKIKSGNSIYYKLRR